MKDKIFKEKREQVSQPHTNSYWKVKIPFKEKNSGYSSYCLATKKENNYLIYPNKKSYTVKLLGISCQKDPIISLEIQQDK